MKTVKKQVRVAAVCLAHVAMATEPPGCLQMPHGNSGPAGRVMLGFDLYTRFLL